MVGGAADDDVEGGVWGEVGGEVREGGVVVVVVVVLVGGGGGQRDGGEGF